MNLLELFVPIDFNQYGVSEFPVDWFPCNDPKRVKAWVLNKDGIIGVTKDYCYVPIEFTENELIPLAKKLILEAAREIPEDTKEDQHTLMRRAICFSCDYGTTTYSFSYKTSFDEGDYRVFVFDYKDRYIDWVSPRKDNKAGLAILGNRGLLKKRINGKKES